MTVGVEQVTPLATYLKLFEAPYLQETKEYYQRESAAFLAQNGVPAYLRKASARLDEETMRNSRYLNIESHDKVKATLDKTLIDEHQVTLQASAEELLQQDRREDLALLTKLLVRVPGSTTVCGTAHQRAIAWHA